MTSGGGLVTSTFLPSVGWPYGGSGINRAWFHVAASASGHFPQGQKERIK